MFNLFKQLYFDPKTYPIVTWRLALVSKHKQTLFPPIHTKRRLYQVHWLHMHIKRSSLPKLLFTDNFLKEYWGFAFWWELLVGPTDLYLTLQRLLRNICLGVQTHIIHYPNQVYMLTDLNVGHHIISNCW